MKQILTIIVLLYAAATLALPARAQEPTGLAPTNTPIPLPPRTLEATPTEKPLAEAPPPFPTPSGTTPITLDVGNRALWDGQVFQIEQIEIDWTPHALNAVALTVRNATDETRRGLVWYLLAPPDAAAPWQRAVYAAVEQPLELAPDESIRITFPAPPDDLIGEWALSVWVHQFDADGARQHSDGVVYDVPLIVGSPFFMTVDQVEAFPDGLGGSLLFVTFTFRNDSDAVIAVGYSYSVSAPDDLTPWETGAYNLPFQPLLLPPRSTLSITSRAVVDLPSGGYRVTGWLQESVDGALQFHNSSVYTEPLQIP
ncbi:MAG: hypothetical protein SGI73_14900 [Chloroflexota bacterium]|nr:hypothetical protein [Chloroflexota bacterium]